MRVTVCPDLDYRSVNLPGFWMFVQWHPRVIQGGHWKVKK
jgi:hypothetical protein